MSSNGLLWIAGEIVEARMTATNPPILAIIRLYFPNFVRADIPLLATRMIIVVIMRQLSVIEIFNAKNIFVAANICADAIPVKQTIDNPADRIAIFLLLNFLWSSEGRVFIFLFLHSFIIFFGKKNPKNSIPIAADIP